MSYDFGGRNYEIYAVKKEDITSFGRPAATLIPHERVLQYNKSNPIFFKNNLNNNIQQTFYGPNTDILRTNNLVCTCGLMTNQLPPGLKCTCKRSYSVKNIKAVNLPFHNSSNFNEKYNYYSNFSTPVCTFYMNRKLKSGYDSDLSNINYNQNFLPNDRNLLLTSRFENRSQKNMLIHMSQRGEEMNNLARNINLKNIYPKRIIHSFQNNSPNEYRKNIPNYGLLPHAPPRYFLQNSNIPNIQYSISSIPRLQISKSSTNIKYICPNCLNNLKIKNSNGCNCYNSNNHQNINVATLYNQGYDVNKTQVISDYNQQMINNIEQNQNFQILKSDDIILNQKENNSKYINQEINSGNQSNNLSQTDSNQNQNIYPMINENLNKNFSEEEIVNLNRYHNTETSESLYQNRNEQNQISEENINNKVLNDDKKEELNENINPLFKLYLIIILNLYLKEGKNLIKLII